MCASNIALVNEADARVLVIERDTAKTVCAERAVMSAIVSTMKKNRTYGRPSILKILTHSSRK